MQPRIDVHHAELSEETPSLNRDYLERWTRRHRHLLWRIIKNEPLTVKVDDQTADELGILNKGKWIEISDTGISRTTGEILLTRAKIEELVGEIEVRPKQDRQRVESVGDAA